MNEKLPFFISCSSSLHLWSDFHDTCTVCLYHQQLEPYRFLKKIGQSVREK